MTPEEEFFAHCSRDTVSRPRMAVATYPCPCCTEITLKSRGDYDICRNCFWEDDGTDEHDVNVDSRFNPNHMSLAEGRSNYKNLGQRTNKV